MKKIFTIGETVYDIIFKDGEIVSGKAGGSMLNASVSLGRVGADITFITEIGNDNLGENILSFLKKNGVDISFIQRFDNGKTPLALAFLDKNQNAAYTFYKSYPEQRLKQQFPVVDEGDIVLFGSFFAIDPMVRQRVLEFIEVAKKSGAIIIYDPNIRNPKGHDLKKIVKTVQENFALADLVRASHEDFLVLFGDDKPEVALEIISEYSDALLLYTHAADFVLRACANPPVYYKVPQIDVVSTIGAGDNFNAGIIDALIKNRVCRKNLKNLDENTWMKIVRSGIHFSQAVCKTLDNYVPQGFRC